MKPGQLEAKQFIERLVSDIRQGPDYRTEMAICESYYDNLQIPAELKAFMESEGRPVIVNNLVQPIINGVLGMEAKTRTDYIIKADDDKGKDLAEALNEKLNEEVRLCKVHRANSDAFKRQTIGGLGWVEVRRNPDPFATKYLVEEVDWREVHYDWRSKRYDLADARWVARDRFVDVDVAKIMMPRFERFIDQCVNGGTFEPINDVITSSVQYTDLVGPYTQEVQSQFDLFNGYVNEQRNQVRILQVQYRVPRRGYVMRFGDYSEEYNPQNRTHVAMVSARRATVHPATYTTVRHAWFIGPHLVHDGPSPYPHNKFNLVPFMGFREGATNAPFGLVRNMMSAQDEINFRRNTLTWLLKARLVIKDDDAVLDSDTDLHSKVQAMDGVINLNPNRNNRDRADGGFKIHSELGVAQQHFNIMQDAMKQMQDLVGVYSSFLGQDSSAKSGIAINSLVEQATVTLSDLFDNYQSSRQTTGELLTAMIEEDIGENETPVSLFVNQSRPTKNIIINERVIKDGGEVVINNRLARLRKHIVLANVQSSPGYRAQQLQQMMELAGTLPDPAKLTILEDIIALMDLPRSDELIKKIKRAIGADINPEEMTEQEKQAQAQQQEQAQAELALLMREREAKVRKIEAEVKDKEASAQHRTRETKAIDSKQKLDDAKAVEIFTQITQQDMQNQAISQEQASRVSMEVDALLSQIPG